MPYDDNEIFYHQDGRDYLVEQGGLGCLAFLAILLLLILLFLIG